LKFNFEATGIGSVPFRNADEACRIILENFTDIPFWPQLSRKSFLENMYVQYSEGLPGLVIDQEKKTVHIDTSRVASDIELVYGKYLDGDVDFFKISENYAQGFYAFQEMFKASPPKAVRFIKGQITGPVSYGLFLTDENKRSVVYDKDLFEVLTKVLMMKARWQIRRLKKLFGAVIFFIDEPYLVSIGSSFVNVDTALVFSKLDELIEAIKKEGALCAIHCCGNTDWSMLLKRDIDILNFDAYNFMKEFSLYGVEIKNYLKRGSSLALGVVPSSEDIDGQTKSSLIERVEAALKALRDKGIEDKQMSIMLTPSCGVGSLEEERAKKVMELTSALSNKLK
jgi:methionine synthase II (cobalamin-independent)